MANAKTYVIRFAGHAGLAALFIGVALFGILSGVMFAYAGDLPLISGLDDYAPSAITRVYASNGETLGEFAIERRLVMQYDDIPPISATRSSRPRTRTSTITSGSACRRC